MDQETIDAYVDEEKNKKKKQNKDTSLGDDVVLEAVGDAAAPLAAESTSTEEAPLAAESTDTEEAPLAAKSTGIEEAPSAAESTSTEVVARNTSTGEAHEQNDECFRPDLWRWLLSL